MPGGNRTGPMGMGPRTGRGAGYCNSNDAPGFMNRFFGRGSGRVGGFGAGQSFGFGSGRGGGRGFGQQSGYRGNAGRGGCFRWRNMLHFTGLPGRMRFGGGYNAQQNVDAGTEKQFLEGQVNSLKSELDRLQQRLSELENTGAKKQ